MRDQSWSGLLDQHQTKCWAILKMDDLLKELLRRYPNLDHLMAETIVDCYKAGTLNTIAAAEAVSKPTLPIIKTIQSITVENSLDG